MKLDVISLGEPLMEFYATQPGRLKDTPLFEKGWGGDTLNLACAVSRLGKKAGYITRIGNDEFGKNFLDLWRKEKIDTSNVLISKGEFTGIYFIAYLKGHEFTYYRKNSAASKLAFKDINNDYIERSKIFHSSGISEAISSTCRNTVLKTTRLAKRKGIIVSFDVNYRPKLWPREIAEKTINQSIKMADIVFLSLEDLKLLYGHHDLKTLSRKLLSSGPDTVVIKLRPKGCLITTNSRSVKAKGFSVKVIDTTGAGDAFAGAFLFGLLEGWDIEKIAEFSNAVGALTSLGKGAIKPIPTMKTVERFLKQQS